MLQQRATTISDAFDLFLLDAQARNLTDNTIRTYQFKLAPFLKWCESQQVDALDEVSSFYLRKFLVSLQQRDISNRTCYNIAKAVKTFINYCVRDELIDVSPFERVQLPRLEKNIQPALTMDEIKAVLNRCRNSQDRAICYVLLDSGLRASELLSLNGADIDVKTGVVTVNRGKGRKDRITRIGAKTQKMLRRYYIDRGYPVQNDPVFLSFKSGKRLTLYGIAHLMARLRESSGIKSCTCHASRRTFALMCLRNGMKIYVLAKRMGHSDIAVLKQYLALVEGDLVEAHQKFAPTDYLLPR